MRLPRFSCACAKLFTKNIQLYKRFSWQPCIRTDQAYWVAFSNSKNRTGLLRIRILEHFRWRRLTQAPSESVSRQNVVHPRRRNRTMNGTVRRNQTITRYSNFLVIIYHWAILEFHANMIRYDCRNLKTRRPKFWSTNLLLVEIAGLLTVPFFCQINLTASKSAAVRLRRDEWTWHSAIFPMACSVPIITSKSTKTQYITSQ